MPTPDTLDSLIRSAVIELLESAPEPPLLPELELERLKHRRHRSRGGSTRAMRISVRLVVATVVIVGVLFGIQLTPGPPKDQQASAATALHQIALAAAQQPVPHLLKNQYLLTDDQVTFSASVTQIANRPTPNAEATVAATIKEWANIEGGSCIEATSPGPAMFASSAMRAGWQSAGLLVDPWKPTSASCADEGSGVVDASSLPNNPVKLAEELTNGSARIPAIDNPLVGGEPGFDRAAAILIGPTIGETSTFRAALFEAMAKLPDVTALGIVKTRSGATGSGFSAPGPSGPSVLVISPSSGALLEARNVPEPQAMRGFGTTYLPEGFSSSFSFNVGVALLDPVGTPTITSLPSGFTPPLPPGSSGTITATTNHGVTSQQVLTLDDTVLQQYGKASFMASSTDGALVFTFLFNGSAMQVHQYAAAMQKSGLFASVKVQGS